MGSGRMESVKTALQIMLRSLPSRNTTFNIVSFGSRHTLLWKTSRAYSSESVEEASKHVDGFTSNYGGTEIRSALESAFSSRVAAGKSAEKIPASVFVLTDGEAWDLAGVIDSVSSSVKKAKTEDKLLRTFVLGVGDQVSTAMCEGIARAGNGTAVFVAVSTQYTKSNIGLTTNSGRRKTRLEANGLIESSPRWRNRRSQSRLGNRKGSASAYRIGR